MAKKKREEDLPSQFKQALTGFLPLIAGSIAGGLETGIAAQEGAMSMQEAQRKAKLDEKKSDREDRSLSLQEREVKVKEDKLKLDEKIASSASKSGPKLGSEDKKRLGSIQMGQAAIEDMQLAIDSGVNKFSIIGDNEFTFARNRFVESIGRLQSGGAINADEQERFEQLVPSSTDSEEIVNIKMNTLREEMSRRFETITGRPSELATSSQAINNLKEIGNQYSLEQLMQIKAQRAAAKGK